MEMALTSQLPSARLLGVIATQTEVARRGLDLGSVMDLVVHRAQALTGASGAVIELIDGADMVYRAASGVAAAQLGLRLRANASLSGHCVRTTTFARCIDSETDPRVDRAACRRVGIRSMLVVPLMYDAKAVGVLKAVSGKADAFAEADLELLQLLSDLVAATMYHAMSHDADELLHRATHDALTGLGNRALFYDALRQTIARAARDGGSFALLYLDMDGLKAANDRLGHAAGDELLRALGHRLQEASHRSDIVARIGGDEFCVILADIASRGQAHATAHRIVERIGGDIDVAGEMLPVCASAGVAVYPEDGGNPEALLQVADRAMYRDKHARKNAC
jgi:diguanylate cyclase (GGDEF)-like protein